MTETLKTMAVILARHLPLNRNFVSLSLALRVLTLMTAAILPSTRGAIAIAGVKTKAQTISTAELIITNTNWIQWNASKSNAGASPPSGKSGAILSSPSPLPSASYFSESDFSNHPNFHLLPRPELNECGHDAYYNDKPPDLRTSSSSRRAKRVVQGVPAGVGNYPWMAQIMVDNVRNDTAFQSHQCGGTIINNYTILTAAHCLSFLDARTGYAVTHVVLGNYKNADGVFKYERESNFTNCGVAGMNRTRICSTAFLAEIDDIVMHPDYTTKGYVNDIALIRLRESIRSFDPVVYTTPVMDGNLQLIRPVCLPTRRDMLDVSGVYEDPNLEFVGWGFMDRYNEPAGIKPTQLMKVRMALKPRQMCSSLFGTLYGKMDETRVCALAEPGRDSCYGDSGGPLMAPLEVNGQRQVFQIGVLTGGGLADCGRQGHASVFSNVVAYMPWILDNLRSSKSATAKQIPAMVADTSTRPPIQPQDFRGHPNFKLLPSRSVCGYALIPNHNHTYDREKRFVHLHRLKRIAGARLAFTGEIPGVAYIEVMDYYMNHQLGGSGVLVSSRYVLTTASFVRSNQNTGNKIHSVRLRTNETHNSQYSYRVEKIILHEDYVYGTKTNDIALLRLTKEVDFEDETNPICLPGVHVNANGHENESASIRQNSSSCSTSNWIGAGWGWRHINYIEMKVRPNDHCDRVHSSKLGKMGPEKLCASSCFGDGTGLCGTTDLGSALLNSIEHPNGEKQYTLYGLASYFEECGIQSLPAFYTNISHYAQWILDNMRP